ncbi:MAG: hypothetical protein I3273_03395 [Candidatus Moeniiplasma glomeromycotorum]|nr:hypothetical protein [Candidatus Moeniiplasma glomeromycotorum]MCE8167746.1 hypothetical protein [Candidatus Moeniiplasma glomeromycotorum]MCE8169146.1 hypothetical protein [Candidatus Moeniiplasma glomeromycotorum]
MFGLNFSELDDRRNSESQGIIIDPKSGIDETNRKLESLTNNAPYSRINEIKGYMNQGNNNRIDTYVDREGIKMDERIEVQPKSDYRLSGGISSIIGGLAGLFLGF